MSIDLRLEARPESAAQARRALDELAGELSRPVLQDLQLMVSELVTNSLRHGGLSPRDRIEVRVALSPRAVRVEVFDPGPGFRPPTGEPSIHEAGGWGLFIVECLADRWGVEVDGVTRVWFELARARS